MKTLQTLVLTVVLTLGGITIFSGCGGGGSTPAAVTAGQAVGGNWVLSRTQTTASDPYCGAAGAVVSESWAITQGAGSGTFTLATLIQGGGGAAHTGTVDSAGKFSVKEERIVSVAGRCFVAALGTYSGDFNAGTGTYTVTFTSDPSTACQPLAVPGTCTAQHNFTIRR